MKKTLSFVLVLMLLATLGIGVVSGQGDEQITLKIGWWGSEARHEKYNQLLDLYEELNPNITFERTGLDGSAYVELLFTQTAAGETFDIIHIHPNFAPDYVGGDRETMVDLTPYMESGALDVSNFPAGIIESGRFSGKLVTVTLGNSAFATHMNPVLFEEAGVEVPGYDWTWQDFIDAAIAVTEGTPDDVWGSSDGGAVEATFATYLRQHGMTLYDGNKLGFDKDALKAYWGIWETLREAGAVPPAQVTAEQTEEHADSLLANGQVAIHFMSGNQHKLFQEYIEDELALNTIPRSADEGAVPIAIVAGAYIGVSALSDHPAEAIAFVNWLVNDPEAAIIYGAEHGPPGSLTMQQVVAPELLPADQRLMELMAEVGEYAVPNEIYPEGSTEVRAAFQRIYEDLMFGNISLDEAVDLFFDEAEFILDF